MPEAAAVDGLAGPAAPPLQEAQTGGDPAGGAVTVRRAVPATESPVGAAGDPFERPPHRPEGLWGGRVLPSGYLPVPVMASCVVCVVLVAGYLAALIGTS
jgi:hypothetical protein